MGDDEASDGRLLSAAEPVSTVQQDMSQTDVSVSQAVNESTDVSVSQAVNECTDAAFKLSTPKSQQLDAAANVVTPMMHKSASKYATLVFSLCL